MQQQETHSKITYGNFQDPIGLVMRMLKSGKRAANTSLIREFLSLGLTPIDHLWKHKEAKLLSLCPTSEELPVILIVGPPRSGSTLIYQALASSLPVSYLNNIGGLFTHAPLVASKFFDRFLPSSAPSFKNYYGNTEKLSDPNDGFKLWDRWLGKDRYAPQQDLSHQQKVEMNHFFKLWMSIFKKPFLNKNNRNTTCLEVLASSLENAYFIVVKRDPVFIAQSLLCAREEIQGSRTIGWGLGSNHTSRDRICKTGLHQVAEQVAWIYTNLEQQTQNIPAHRLIHVNYETFCQEPITVISEIYNCIWSTIPGPPIQPKPLKAFKASQHIRISHDEFSQLQTLVQEYLTNISHIEDGSHKPIS